MFSKFLLFVKENLFSQKMCSLSEGALHIAMFIYSIYVDLITCIKNVKYLILIRSAA